MKHRVCLLVLILIFTGHPLAQWREGSIEVPDSSGAKSKAGFGAALYLSDKPADFLDAWEKPTEGVHIQTADTVARGVPIVAFVIFSGCKANDQGLCNATVDFTVLTPDGSEYASYKDEELWKNKPPIPTGQLGLSVAYVGVIIEPTDPLGKYQFQAAVHDLNAEISLGLEQSFTAVESDD